MYSTASSADDPFLHILPVRNRCLEPQHPVQHLATPRCPPILQIDRLHGVANQHAQGPVPLLRDARQLLKSFLAEHRLHSMRDRSPSFPPVVVSNDNHHTTQYPSVHAGARASHGDPGHSEPSSPPSPSTAGASHRTPGSASGPSPRWAVGPGSGAAAPRPATCPAAGRWRWASQARCTASPR